MGTIKNWKSVLNAVGLTVLLCSCQENITEKPLQSSSANPEAATEAAAASTITYTDESSFVNTLSSYGFKTAAQLSLNREASTSGYTSVYGFNIPVDRRVTGFKWNSNDEQTTDWRPQGIGGFTLAGRKFILASWYAIGPDNIPGVNNQHKGARISLVDITDMTQIKYRHIILVQNTANRSNPALFKASNSYVQLGSFAPVTIHAGGVTCHAGKLYVADTKLGIRVFDLSKFVSVKSGDAKADRIGKEANGELKAFNYAYVLPQSGYYKITNAAPFSCIELGEGATAPEKILWTSQYIEPDATLVPRVFGFPVDAAGNVNTAVQPKIITPIDNDGTHVHGIQGVYRAGTKTFMSSTGNSSFEGSTARLVRYNDGTAEGTRYRWPHGAEDLYRDGAYLWCLTEFETNIYGKDNRCVFAVRVADYD